MKIIAGFGNPEQKYNFTRHNFGFLTLDFYLKTKNLTWEKNQKFDAIYLKNDDTIFLKPQLYYNDSGIPIQKFINYYKIPLENLLIICDDFNLPFETLRYREKGSDGGNNGLKSVTKMLNTPNYPRLRLGTENAELRQKLGDIEFVLSKFTEKERLALPNILSRAAAEIDEFLKKS